MARECIGILAGGGQLPFLVADGARRQGQRVAAAGFAGNTDPALAGRVDVFQELRLGQLGRLIAFFQAESVTRVVLAGSINKPRALDVRPDMRAMKLLMRLATRGDDSLLRAVAGELESEGMAVVSALDLVPDLAAPAGVLTRKKPSKEQWEDLRYAWPRAKALGRMDIGQALAVKERMVVAVEGLEGTDACIARAGGLAPGCVLVKIVKPNQDIRFDLPSVGLGTIEALAAAGVSCLGVEAGKSLFFDREAALDLAQTAGLAVVGLTPAVLGLPGDGEDLPDV
ncbi:MAG: UDP-2,3-diacylglucosamine diphosphatase LpxI [Thermodesulfobacteriota bacterium]